MFLTDLMNKKTMMPDPARALPGRPEPIPTSDTHFVNGRPPRRPLSGRHEAHLLGMGCFWGAERAFLEDPGRLGHGGRLRRRLHAPTTYQETVTGLTGHAEVVLVVYDPKVVS